MSAPNPKPDGQRRGAADPDRASGEVSTPATEESLAAPDSIRAIDVLQKLKSGELSGKLLGPETRQAVVSTLTADGASVAEIAAVLKVSDRTIERDRAAIAKRLALHKDPNLTGEVLGRLLSEAELAIQRIRATLRDKGIDPAVRIEGHTRWFQIMDRLVERLQSAGRVDRAPQQLQADLSHHVSIPTAEALSGELARLKAISPDSPALRQMDSVLARARAATLARGVVSASDGTEVVE